MKMSFLTKRKKNMKDSVQIRIRESHTKSRTNDRIGSTVAEARPTTNPIATPELREVSRGRL